jgi:hypothetical protein
MKNYNNLLLLIGLSLLALAFFINIKFPKTDIAKINNYRSSAFASQNVSDPHLSPSQNEVMEISVPEFDFKAGIPQNSHQIQVSFFYKCQPSCNNYWLKVKAQDQNHSLDFLVDHQIMQNLNWFLIEKDGIRLYQKEVFFDSAEELISSGQPFLSEKSLVFYKQISSQNIKFLEETETLNNIEYIVTTYNQPRIVSEWRQFAQIFSTDKLYRDKNNNLLFQLTSLDKNLEKVWISEPKVEYY